MKIRPVGVAVTHEGGHDKANSLFPHANAK